MTDDYVTKVFHRSVVNAVKEQLSAALAEAAKWKDEYENLCKFTNDFEEQRDRYRLALERIADSSCEAFEHQRLAKRALNPGGEKD